MSAAGFTLGRVLGHLVRGASMGHPNKLAITEHIIYQGHRIQFHILATKTRYTDRIVNEIIEVELHPYSFNFCLSKT